MGEDRDTGTYSINHPRHGRTRPGPSVGTPAPVEADETPIPEPPRVDGPNPHLDVEGTLVDIHRTIQQMHRNAAKEAPQSGIYREPDVLADIEKRLKKTQGVRAFGAWVVGLVSVVFSAGVAYQMFLGSNATDTEVEDAVEKATIEHNGIDPTERDEQGQEYGAHPQMQQAIDRNADAVESIKTDLGSMEIMQRKLDKRSEYQYEYNRWKERVVEAKSKRRRPPQKPAHLQQLERELMLGIY